jgi:hypothetical protein
MLHSPTFNIFQASRGNDNLSIYLPGAVNPGLEPTFISLLVMLPTTAIGGLVFWLHHRKAKKPNAQPPRLLAKPRHQLPSAATAAPTLLAALRGEHQEPLLCPACRREFEENYRHCLFDASPLLPHSRAQELPGGMVCPQCSRGFEPGVRNCLHDAEELIPYSLSRTTRSPLHEPGEACPNKICPLCTHKYQGEATFCGRDGAELVSMN